MIFTRKKKIPDKKYIVIATFLLTLYGESSSAVKTGTALDLDPTGEEEVRRQCLPPQPYAPDAPWELQVIRIDAPSLGEVAMDLLATVMNKLKKEANKWVSPAFQE